MHKGLHTEEPARQRRVPPQWRAFLELGFRPLYLLGCGWAALSVLLWVFAPQALVAVMPGVIWHAHEMLWGFVATIAVGFLLTAGATWTGINPMQGKPLAALVGLWLVARAGFLLSGTMAFWVAAVAELLFFLTAAMAMARAVHVARNVRNYGVAPLMLALAVADAAYLWASWQGDYGLLMQRFHLGMLCMVLLAVLIARRVIPFFASRAISGLDIPMLAVSGRWQLGAGILAVAVLLLGWSLLAAVALAVVGALALWQVFCWKPWRVLGVPLLWILYLGYAGLGSGLLVAAAHTAGWVARAVWPMHVIGIAGFSMLIIGMVTRTALGHLGQPLRTDYYMVSAYVLVMAACLLRLLALLPGPWALGALHLSAVSWALAFACYLWRFIPMLVRPRADQPAGRPANIPLQPTQVVTAAKR